MTVLPRFLAAVGVLALGLGGALVVAAPANAATLTVSNLNDSGAGSLRDAIDQANTNPGADVILFSVSGTIPLVTALPEITDDLTITGPGTSSLTISGSALAAGDSGLKAATLPGYVISIAALTLANFPGDGLEFQYSDVALDQVSSIANGGDGLLIVDGDLTVTSSTFTNNGSSGIHVDMAGAQVISITGSSSTANDFGLDGNFLAGASVTLTGDAFDDNASGGAGFYSGNGATVAITGSTFNRNNPSGSSSPGGLSFYSDGSTVTIDSSEFADNKSVAGAGMQPTIVNGGTIAITNTRVTGNHAMSGGLGLGGGIYLPNATGSTAQFSLTDSVVSGNSSDGAGGGLLFEQIGFNAPIAGVQITRTTIDGNSAPEAAGLGLRSWTTNTTAGEPVVYVQDSTISNNTGDDGAAVYAVDTSHSTGGSVIAFQNSTIANNSAANGSGGLALVGSGYPTVFVFAHSTIASNSGTGPSGISIQAPDIVRILLSHTIVADNTATDIEASAGSQVLIDWSFVETADATTDTALTAGTGNHTGIDPKLGPLVNNGGPTMTKLPAAGSPVIDAGNPSIALYPATDQRGQARIINIIDIGAVEAAPLLPNTGQSLTPGPPLVAFLLLFTGLAMVAFSRLQGARSVG